MDANTHSLAQAPMVAQALGCMPPREKRECFCVTGDLDSRKRRGRGTFRRALTPEA